MDIRNLKLHIWFAFVAHILGKCLVKGLIRFRFYFFSGKNSEVVLRHPIGICQEVENVWMSLFVVLRRKIPVLSA